MKFTNFLSPQDTVGKFAMMPCIPLLLLVKPVAFMHGRQLPLYIYTPLLFVFNGRGFVSLVGKLSESETSPPTQTAYFWPVTVGIDSEMRFFRCCPSYLFNQSFNVIKGSRFRLSLSYLYGIYIYINNISNLCKYDQSGF